MTLFLLPLGSSAAELHITEYQSIAVLEVQNRVDRVQFVLQKRLAIMHEVARTKWNQNLPIEDLAREQELLAGLAEQGKRKGIDEKWVLAFFQVFSNLADIFLIKSKLSDAIWIAM